MLSPAPPPGLSIQAAADHDRGEFAGYQLNACKASGVGTELPGLATELANKKVTATERAEKKLPACQSQAACTARPASLKS